jgi:flagellar protein FlgJ
MFFLNSLFYFSTGAAMSDTGGSSFRPGAYRPPPVVKPMEEKLRDASKMYEKLFMREMMKAMRSTVTESGFIKANQAEKIFRDELDQEYVDKWSEKGGVGFADLIYDNMMERFGVQLGLRSAVDKPKGPIALDSKSQFNGPTRVPTRSDKELSLRFDRNPVEAAKSAELAAPWSGLLTRKKDLGDGNYSLEIQHDNGLSGRLVFRGTPERLNVGQSVQEGDRIGLLSSEAKSFFWSVDGSKVKAQNELNEVQASPAEAAMDADSLPKTVTPTVTE